MGNHQCANVSRPARCHHGGLVIERSGRAERPAPVPPAGEERCGSISGPGVKPQRVQGRALPPAAQARGAGAEPRRPPRRRGVQGQRPAAVR